MSTFIAYKPAEDGRKLYLKQDKTFTENKEEARKFRIKLAVQIIELVLYIIKIFGNKLKIEKL